MQGVKKGFTLIELSLSLVFIGILSLTIALIINDTIATYRRGLTLNQINTAGMDLVDDMRAAVQNSSTKSVVDDCELVYKSLSDSTKRANCKNSGGRNFVTLTRTAKVVGRNGGETLNNMPVFGAFCTGTYSYIWNSGYFFNTEKNAYKVDGVKSAELKFNYKYNINGTQRSGTATERNFRFLKVRDETRSVCVIKVGGVYNYNSSNITPVFDLTGTNETIEEQPIDLLKTDEQDSGLAIYDLYVSSPAESTAKNTLFYSASFILGTVQGGINIKKSGSFCATPDDYEIENYDYCAINKFNFAAQATGE